MLNRGFVVSKIFCVSFVVSCGFVFELSEFGTNFFPSDQAKRDPKVEWIWGFFIDYVLNNFFYDLKKYCHSDRTEAVNPLF